MKNQDPEVSIIMATYNRADLIAQTLNSIKEQTFGNWECLVIDDGSTDETEEIVKSYSDFDKRFHYFKRSSDYLKGLPGSRNQGLDLSKGNYIIFFDDDDIVHLENLQTCVNILRRNNTDFCRYNKRPFRKDFSSSFQPIGKIASSRFEINDLPKMITGEVPFASCCVMWDRKCFKKHRFNEELMYAEEWECYSRILAEGYRGESIENVLYFNRKHPDSNTGRFRNANPIQIRSQCEAAKIVMNNMNSMNLFNEKLEKFFIRMGFELKSREIVMLSLELAHSGKIKKMKYYTGFLFYPVLRPFFYLKGKLQAN